MLRRPGRAGSAQPPARGRTRRDQYSGGMPHTFDDETLTGVLGHMNRDHSDDNLLIARAFSPIADVISATMTTFDGAAGQWHVITADGVEDVIQVPWPGGEIAERREVRREIVALYDAACARLGVDARPHD
ncbi:hypothetical protein GCM10010462_12530 [Microbacterium dextranolyticum]|uniref:DUF2470 domain-containing protein n=2 Tax=Microbacterium dextranolyticum TaxID=36806 RepID=A0A9W6HJQ0_9MICO|nr:hypothetical protein GCM10017591_00700 [Microbacterium dextranolyticum]